MARLTVKNVGPIREADFEVKKYTVFIGPQGSGKSTLAKLIAICTDSEVVSSVDRNQNHFEDKYQLNGYLSNKSDLLFEGKNYVVEYAQKFRATYGKDLKSNIDFETINIIIPHIQEAIAAAEAGDTEQMPAIMGKLLDETSHLKNLTHNGLLGDYESIYILTERILTSTLSNAVWSLIYSQIELPKAISRFLIYYNQARQFQQSFSIPFLKISYSYLNKSDKLILENNDVIDLGNSASGFQSLLPILMVVEHQRIRSKYRFIIEKPELNLYPTAQKDLIYNLVSGLDPTKTYRDAEWVFTTHSPYVLSSLNTLMLAYKVAHQSEENRAKVEAIIPARHWINPDDFAAYYVDGGTVESIVNEDTGLINASRLDDVSDDFADEQEALFTLYRNALKVRA